MHALHSRRASRRERRIGMWPHQGPSRQLSGQTRARALARLGTLMPMHTSTSTFARSRIRAHTYTPQTQSGANTRPRARMRAHACSKAGFVCAVFSAIGRCCRKKQ
eukprot:3761108-Pleurochrysis_carterae.AAC.1